MDELLEFVEEYDEIQFLVSLDYNQDESELYSCNEWANLYDELGEFGNNPLILNTDPEHPIWNMFSGTTYSAYAFIDHNMVLRYKFDMPNLYDFQYTYIPNLLDEMHGCIDSNACNYDISAVIDDESCLYNNECSQCDDASTQNDCMEISGCMWMGDHCMEFNDGCMDYYNEFDCLNQEGCYWMGNHCMTGSTCTDPIAFNYNPIADAFGDGDNSACLYSEFIVFGCRYESANNFNPDANVDDGTCEYSLGDLNEDGTLDILDVVSLVNIIMNFFTD